MYADDFSLSEIEEWFADEKLGYQNLVADSPKGYKYGYHALNLLHGFRHLPDKNFAKVLGVGSAFGDELLPLVAKLSHITILEPGSAFAAKELAGVPVEKIVPSATGIFPFPDGQFDLVTCLGVLHHIPNVTTVLGEMFRCAADGGYLLLREPVISMGDWRHPRKGLTKRERGIPSEIFRDLIVKAGFSIVSEQKCCFPATARLRYFIQGSVYNSRVCTAFDSLICRFPYWPRRYHATRFWHKLRPQSVYYVLKKVRAEQNANWR